jgi:hypothetical protein
MPGLVYQNIYALFELPETPRLLLVKIVGWSYAR